MNALLISTLILTQTASSISWYSEFKAGGYIPQIDTEFSGSASPYQDIFGTKKRPTYRFSLEYRLISGFGSVYVGGSLGFFYASGKALASDGSPSEDNTAIFIIPFTIKASYRFDFLYDKWGIPLVPYLKGAVVYAPWFITAPDGSIATWDDNSKKAQGATKGWESSIGLSFPLDILEPTAARTMDHEWGVNNTYIFVEYNHLVLDNFGDTTSLILSDDQWFFGISMEY